MALASGQTYPSTKPGKRDAMCIAFKKQRLNFSLVLFLTLEHAALRIQQDAGRSSGRVQLEFLVRLVYKDKRNEIRMAVLIHTVYRHSCHHVLVAICLAHHAPHLYL